MQRCKCDRSLPICSRCSTLGKPCSYERDVIRKGPKKDYAAFLSQRLADLLAYISTQEQGHGLHEAGSVAPAPADPAQDPATASLSAEELATTWKSPYHVDLIRVFFERHSVHAVSAAPKAGSGAASALPFMGPLSPAEIVFARPSSPCDSLLFRLFMSTVQQRSDILLNSIYAYACILAHRDGSGYMRGQTFYLTAKRHLDDELNTQPTMDTLCAIMLLALYQRAEDKPSSGLLVGLAVRMAQSLGMHTEPQDWIDRPSQTILHEQRRRVWWMLYQLDRLSTTSLTLPFIIDEGNTRVGYPCMGLLSTEAIACTNQLPEIICLGVEPSPLGDGSFLQQTLVPLPHSSRTNTVYMHYIKLVSILGKITDAARRADDEDPSELQMIHSLIDLSLQSWLSALPPFMRTIPSSYTLDHFVENAPHCEVAFVQLLFHFSKLRLKAQNLTSALDNLSVVLSAGEPLDLAPPENVPYPSNPQQQSQHALDFPAPSSLPYQSFEASAMHHQRNQQDSASRTSAQARANGLTLSTCLHSIKLMSDILRRLDPSHLPSMNPFLADCVFYTGELIGWLLNHKVVVQMFDLSLIRHDTVLYINVLEQLAPYSSHARQYFRDLSAKAQFNMFAQNGPPLTDPWNAFGPVSASSIRIDSLSSYPNNSAGFSNDGVGSNMAIPSARQHNGSMNMPFQSAESFSSHGYIPSAGGQGLSFSGPPPNATSYASYQSASNGLAASSLTPQPSFDPSASGVSVPAMALQHPDFLSQLNDDPDDFFRED
ncbi:fungal-specific transcription factor domain-containing protein [Entophlyctis helioformis]|nr:fungal-specific transcription factor domain-containing protein [Entophlyctis helioformis]